VLGDTDISMKPYFIARLRHAVYAGVLTIYLFKPAESVFGQIALPSFESRDFLTATATGPMLWDGMHWAILLAGTSLAALGVSAAGIGMVQWMKTRWTHVH
ncbi:MAG: sporulation integral membrane protein YlbJ, partial [Firmicutes bacterium]|nr:sporulation integral membrane protein YlbJ [Bacillota bacterium]